MKRQLPNLTGSTTKETVDKLSNTSHMDNHDQIIQNRKEAYYWEVEVPRFVQTYDKETCLRQGWLYYDDKGQLQVRTKPPGTE